MPVLGDMQTVQRAELWVATIALQAYWPCHLGIDYLKKEADTAADLGRRHQFEVLIDARRRLREARGHWYPIMLDLHSFMIAVARVSVNHEGKSGNASDGLIWDQGADLRFVILLLELMLILHHFLALLVS